MIADVKKLLLTVPFEPFTIITSGGNRYPVPSHDHASINPIGNRLLVWFDDGSGVTVSGLHISAVETPAAKNGPPQ